MAIAMDALGRKTSSTGATTDNVGRDDAPELRSLALLSSLATLMSDDPIEGLEQHQQQQQQHQHQQQHNPQQQQQQEQQEHNPQQTQHPKRKKSASRSSPALETFDSFKRQSQKGSPVRLSRSFSTINLQLKPSFSLSLLHQQSTTQAAVPTTTPSLTQEQRQQHQQPKFPHEKATRTKSSPLIPFAIPSASEQIATNSSSSSAEMFQQLVDQREEPTRPGLEKGTEAHRGDSGATTTATPTMIASGSDPAHTNQSSSSSVVIHCLPDDISRNVYRSYEMQLPDLGSNAGYIVPSEGNNNNSSIGTNGNTHKRRSGPRMDEYNDVVFTCCPLRDPPRLPSAEESLGIAERSKEEKNNWGWYA
mmetsp:Transcript_23162/g.47212  ORF Transcript_23162/g.47212 Transcript_23162/m.47212 type:complete len:362 (-) Transcript_23162:142-1227(-)